MLKADLHIHTSEDVADSFIEYNAYALIDRVAELGFDVVSITNHNCWTFSQHLADYARDRGILLIPGIELSVQGKHVLAYMPFCNRHRICSNINELMQLKDRQTLFIAPHPFFPSRKSLGKNLIRWRALFDAIEFCHLYTSRFNYNHQAVRTARDFTMPLVGTSDCHVLQQLNTTYTLIDAERDIVSIFDAIKNGNLVLVSSPLQMSEIVRIMYGILLHHVVKKIGNACRSMLTLKRREAL